MKNCIKTFTRHQTLFPGGSSTISHKLVRLQFRHPIFQWQQRSLVATKSIQLLANVFIASQNFMSRIEIQINVMTTEASYSS